MKNYLLCAIALGIGSTQAALIAHYTFDDDGSAAVGTDATFGTSASVDNSNFAVGSGSLALSGPTTDTAGNDGAVSGNNFDWTSNTRAVAFWMRATGGDANRTMISLGGGTGNGTRFDIRLNGNNLRLEVQGGGGDTSVNVGDGEWYHVAVSVTEGDAVGDALYWVHDFDGDLVSSGDFGTNTRVIDTNTGPLRIGDSYQDTSRDFFGNLDDVRLYDNAIDGAFAAGLAGQAVPEPSSSLLVGIAGLGFLVRRRK